MTDAAMPGPPAEAEGAAFPLVVRLLASLLVGGILAYGWSAARELLGTSWTASAVTCVAGALAMVLWCLYWIWASRTRVDATGIRQSWLWDKQVRWDEVTQARIVAVAGLDWLVAPRLLVRARGRGGLLVFHAADRGMLLRAFDRRAA
ncbi:MAG: hypothetical protein V4864_23540 [Pseudomonadota bacterium]